MTCLKRLFYVMAIMALSAAGATAQYATTHAKAAMPGQQKGIYYALPRTVIRLDFIIEETQLIEGPYSEYVSYIGADDFVVEDANEYRIVDVKMSTYAEADPNATFFVAMVGKKAEANQFFLTPQGILQGVGIQGPALKEPTADLVLEQPATSVDPSFKYQYSPVGMKSEEQMARAAADMINTIREEKIKLVTGFQETAFTADTYRQMFADLDAMENDYLSLFIGKKIVSRMVKSVYVTPSKEVTLQTVAKFSKYDGFTPGTSGTGAPITVQTLSLMTTSSINQPSPSAVETLAHENKLFYRIPESANIRVNVGDEVVCERREIIAQLGVFMLAPLGKTALGVDPNTGQITSMSME